MKAELNFTNQFFHNPSLVLKVNRYCCMCVHLRHVGYGYVTWLSDNPYGEVGFEGRLIKTGEGCTSKGGFKLRGCQDPDDVNNSGITRCKKARRIIKAAVCRNLKINSSVQKVLHKQIRHACSHRTSPLLVR